MRNLTAGSMLQDFTNLETNAEYQEDENYNAVYNFSSFDSCAVLKTYEKKT